MVGRLSVLVVGALAALVSANEPPMFHAAQPTAAQATIVFPPKHEPEPTPVHQAQSACLKPLDCGTMGCRPEPLIGTGTTIVPHPSGLPHATAAIFIGPDKKTTTAWQATHTTTLFVPSCSPSAPPCASWAITHVPTTMILGTETVVFNEPSITAVGPAGGATVTKTTVSTTTSISTSLLVIPTTVTTTSIPPPVTTTSISTTTSTHITILTAPGVTTTSTSTTTTTVTSVPANCPTQLVDCPLCPTPVAPKVEPTGCVRKVKVDWTNINIFKDFPPTFEYDHAYGSIFKIQDADTKDERYAVSLDGKLLGATSDASIDPGIRCGTLPSARLTCKAMGFSRGEWDIPAGKHAITVSTIFNHKNDGQSHASTFFYSLEQVCPGDHVVAPSCAPDVIHGWAKAEVYEGRPLRLDTFHYTYPVKVTVQDAGYKTEKYIVTLDGTEIGRTHDYDSAQNEHCGITVDTAEKCHSSGYSSGTFVVPSGKHVVNLNSISTRSLSTIEPYSTVFYKIEKYCE